MVSVRAEGMESSGMVRWWQADGSLSWFPVGFSNKCVLLLQEKFEVKDLNMKPGMSLKIKGKIHNDVDRYVRCGMAENWDPQGLRKERLFFGLLLTTPLGGSC